jgi:hypothetical protein
MLPWAASQPGLKDNKREEEGGPPEHLSAGNYLESDYGGGSLHSHFLNYDLHHAASIMLSFSFASQISQMERGVSRISLQVHCIRSAN